MEKNRKNIVIIAASGKGSRFGSEVPKQFLKIGNDIMLCKTARAFIDNENIDEIYITIPKGYEEYSKEIFAENFTPKEYSKIEEFVCGGKERQDSIYEAIKIIEAKHGLSGDYAILVHDGARPFVSKKLTDKIIEETWEKGAVIPTMPVTETIRIETDNDLEILDRNKLVAAQTPQGFKGDIIIGAYKDAQKNKISSTDDGQLVQKFGFRLYKINGESTNIKVTFQDDMLKGLDNNYHEVREKTKESELMILPRVGIGYDVHELVKGRDLYLGGVNIPFEKGLLGHSDADVLLHAIMDSILGAAGLGDIGIHFPPSDDTYKDISSIRLLEKVKEIIEIESFEIINIDATVICEKPKIKDYVSQMKLNISKALNISENRINLKGTTTEKLGFTGRMEGIAAQSICSVIAVTQSNKM